MASLPTHYRGPGLVDLQVNGYAGVDFNAPPGDLTAGDFHVVRKAQARRGVRAALPTFITDDVDRMVARIRQYAAFVDEDRDLAEAFPKLHIEGPFIASEDGPRGAHPPQHCTTPKDQPDLFSRLQEASGGRIGLLTLAPELPGALDLISEASENGTTVALGHTEASAETIQEAVKAGARMSTHLGNGSHQMLPRLDNYVQVQLAEDRLSASFIADGHHMPFYTLRNFLRAKTTGHSVLVTDAILAADVGPGRYTSTGAEIVVTPDLRVSKPGEPNLAGSALTLDRAVINTCSACDVPFSEAWRMASTYPAALVGIEEPAEVSVDVSPERFTVSADRRNA